MVSVVAVSAGLSDTFGSSSSFVFFAFCFPSFSSSSLSLLLSDDARFFDEATDSSFAFSVGVSVFTDSAVLDSVLDSVLGCSFLAGSLLAGSLLPSGCLILSNSSPLTFRFLLFWSSSSSESDSLAFPADLSSLSFWSRLRIRSSFSSIFLSVSSTVS